MAQVAQAATQALEALRLACREQARQDHPRASYVAQHYKPPHRAARSG